MTQMWEMMVCMQGMAILLEEEYMLSPISLCSHLAPRSAMRHCYPHVTDE